MLKFKQRSKTSFLYITHDLSTAHYISDIIAIMYRGSIMEMGAMNKIIDEPTHPYVKLLVESLPIPDPKRRWRRIVLPHEELMEQMPKGCKFYDRCPRRMDVCSKKKSSSK